MVRSYSVSLLLVLLYFATLIYIYKWVSKINPTLFKQQQQHQQQLQQQRQQQQQHFTQLQRPRPQIINHKFKKLTTDTIAEKTFYNREFKKSCTTTRAWLKHDDERFSYNRMKLVGMFLLTWWTFFWKVVLIWILQRSQLIHNKSAIFLLQQMTVVELVTFVFALTLTSSIPFLEDSSDFWKRNFDRITIFFFGFVLFQHTLFTLYLGLRLYLTYRRNGTIVVVFGYKTFFFVLMTLVHLAWISINLTDLEVKTGEMTKIAEVGVFITQKIIALMIIAFLFKRRRQEVGEENRISQSSMWIHFILNIIHLVCTLKIMTYLKVDPSDVAIGLRSERKGKNI